MAHTIEVASTGRAKCRGCGQNVSKGERRFGEELPNPFADGENQMMTHWFHLQCAAYRRPEPFLEALKASTEPIENRDSLVADAELGVAHHRVPRISAADHAPTGRATCRACKQLIEKGDWRIALVFYEDGRFSPSGYVHASCAKAYFETPAIRSRLAHFAPALTTAELDAIAAEIG